MKNIFLIVCLWTLMTGLTSVFGQTISDEARRHYDRGMAAVELAKSPADYEIAITEFKQAIALAPDWADAYYNLGRVQEAAEKFADAIASFRQYLRLAPEAGDAGEVRSVINKLEFKQEQEEGVNKVYEMMTKIVAYNKSGSYERKQLEHKKLGQNDAFDLFMTGFRMMSGKLEVRNSWIDPGNDPCACPELHPPIEREWEPVKVNGRFYEFSYSYYMPVQTGYVVRYDYEVKGEIISIEPPRLKVISRFSVTWGAPLDRSVRPWSLNDNYQGAGESTYELVTRGVSINTSDGDVTKKGKVGNLQRSRR